MIKITKGLDLPIAGLPDRQRIDDVTVNRVAVKGEEYVGLRPSMAVKEGDRVVKGQLLFEDKKIPGVRFTAPASGTVSAIHRGERRVLQSVVIDIDGDASLNFTAYSADDLATLPREVVAAQLIESYGASAMFLVSPSPSSYMLASDTMAPECPRSAAFVYQRAASARLTSTPLPAS